VFATNLVLAQQLPIFTQYNEYLGIISPAFLQHEATGDNFRHSVGLAYRDQWTQLPNRPKTVAARFETKTQDRRGGTKLNLGAYYIHDQIGVFTNSDLKLRIATSFKLRENRRGATGFSAGINVGIGQYRVDLSKIPYAGEDPILFQENTVLFRPDAGIGLAFYNRFRNDDFLQIAVSIPQFLDLTSVYQNEEKEFVVNRVPHFYVVGNYIKVLKKDKHISFSSWVKRVKNIPTYADLMVRYKFVSHMWIGAGFNSAGILHSEMGLSYDMTGDRKADLSYSFNPTFKTHSVIFGNIHELTLSYLFN